jgi:hypothetical protein
MIDPSMQYEEDLRIAYMCGVRDASKRIKLLKQRVIDLQGHDDLSYIDKRLSEQEEVERLRAKKKQIYEDLKDAVEVKLKEKNGG